MKITIVGLVVLIAVVSCDDASTTAPTESTPTAKPTDAPTAAPPPAPTETPKTSTISPPEPTTVTPPIFPSDDAKFPAPVEFKVWITGTEQTCLDVKLAAQIVLSNGTKFLNLEKAVRADATNCTNENDTNIALNLDFGGNSISFVFKRDEALTSGWLDTIHLTYHVDNATKPETFDITEKLFESNGTASFGLQYSCKGQVETETLHGTKVVFKEVDVQVGSSQHGTHLTSCPADEDVNDMIPIAVGAALLALVAIVLVAYFVGRRRSRRLAYQSV